MKAWFLAIRPWTLTASLVPISLGTALAFTETKLFLWTHFFAALGGGMLLQIGANLLNTYSDYVKGVDTIASAHSCPQLVTGTMTPQAMQQAARLAVALGTLLGLWLTYECGWPIAFCGLIGIIGAYTYTGGPLPYKYRGLGSIFVFFLMGPLMVWPAYYVQTEVLSFWPIIASLPISFLVAAILHANDLRDLEDDKEAGIQTLALFLGLNRAMALYFFLYSAAFLSLAALIAAQLLPLSAAFTFLLAPLAIKELHSARLAWLGDRTRMIFLVKNTASFHGKLGLLLAFSIFLHNFNSL
ncbi:MAG: 1,4-dihydroxy-2-naphthoate octaprenyltransferase [Sporomusaceae bacterium]|nr:1,4-dihydroxy-2-naphthoate octaprenyltransferase [Sporomusaceae bacterium]